MKYYIRFGKLPEDGHSRQHRGDGIIKTESGISVYDCAIANDVYYPLLPKNFNESALQGYIGFLWGNRPVFLVTGVELPSKGADNEPLLKDVKIIKDLTDDYQYFKKMFNR